MVILFSIGASFFYGLSDFITRVGLKYSNARSAALFSMIAGMAAPLIIAFFTLPLSLFTGRAVLYFILAGFIGPCIARYLLYVGIEKVGVSIAIPLANMRPLFGSLIAVAILGERLTPAIAGATLLIIAGAIAISLEKTGGFSGKGWSQKDLIFPLAASFCYGSAYVLRKLGADIISEPMVGVVVQNTAALVFLALLTPLQRYHQSVDMWNLKAWFFFGLGGLLAFVANYCIFYALGLGKVVIVAPLVALNPFFTLLLTAIFLKNVERVTGKIVFGAILIVMGTVVLTLVSHD